MYDNIMNLKQIQEGLKDRRLYAVKQATGISYPTLKKLSDGVVSNYTIGTLSVVSKYIYNSQLNLSENEE